MMYSAYKLNKQGDLESITTNKASGGDGSDTAAAAADMQMTPPLWQKVKRN